MALRIFYPANIRFPMERANSVQILAMAQALSRQGAGVRLAVRRMDRRSPQQCLAFYGAVPVKGFRLLRYPVLNLHESDRIWDGSYHLVMVADLMRQLLAGSLDVLYCRSVGIARLGIRLRRLFPRLKVVLEVHTLSAETMAFNSAAFSDGKDWSAKAPALARREAWVAQRADLLLPLTTALAEGLRGMGAVPERIRICPDGVDLSRWKPAAAWPPPSGGHLLYAGHLYPWKGADVLVPLMAALPEERLTVAGGTPHENDLERLKASAASAGVSDRIDFLGFVEPGRLPAVTARAAVGLLPLPGDNPFAAKFTSPLKLFEYMAAGLPIVASDLPAIREILTDGVNALLVPPGDPKAIAAAVRRLRTEPGLAERLRTRALQDVQNYTWDRRARQVIEALS